VFDDVREKINEARSALVAAIADVKMMEKNADKLEVQAGEWQSKALAAMQSGDDVMARRALEKKREIVTVGERYREQIAEHRVVIDELKRGLRKLEARAKALTSESAGSGLNVSSVFSDYDRMVSRIEEMEAEVEAVMELEGELGRTPR
jgi:phage shock protein A